MSITTYSEFKKGEVIQASRNKYIVIGIKDLGLGLKRYELSESRE